MRAARLDDRLENAREIESIYGPIDLDLGGKPTVSWERRYLKLHRLDEPLQHAFYPDCWVHKILVNKRIDSALGNVMREINARWTPEVRKIHGLDQFLKCYVFGDGNKPNLHWYGAAWQLSGAVNGEMLGEAIKVFARHGFTYAGLNDKKRPRTFEFW
jgi:hypothetical protein